jgi:3-methylcrotonyl-CoA carboxylase alpha subunit
MQAKNASYRPIRKVLIANRGEIALRVMRTCKKLGIATVAVYSSADKNAPFVEFADEAIGIGGPTSKESYLNQDSIINAAKRANVDAIHPGYGFLSENSTFSARIEQEGFIFIGPKPDSIDRMGSKIGAKNLLTSPPHAGKIPVIPGYNGSDQSVEKLTAEALKIGFPVLLKASAGGGGKGMRVVRQRDELEDTIASCKREGQESFGDASLLIEKYFDRVRHIEIQIFGDSHGNVVHLGERDCSVQRRHQKIIEETPSPIMSNELREKMGQTACVIGQAINYLGAGTVEFIFDEDSKQFFFLEVNTRLQVEHPITEAVTGLDLVEIQIRVAEGVSLWDLGLKQINRRGHAIECRVYAEDPLNDFLPAVGKIHLMLPSDTPGMRYDSGVRSGSEVSIYYDPMIAKVIAYGRDRIEATQLMIKALSELVIFGNLQTNQKFLIQVLTHPKFVQGEYNTHFINNFLPKEVREQYVALDEKAQKELCIAALMFDWHFRTNKRALFKFVTPGLRNVPYRPQTMSFTLGKQTFELQYTHMGAHKAKPEKEFEVKIGGEQFLASYRVVQRGPNSAVPAELSQMTDVLLVSVNGMTRPYTLFSEDHDDVRYKVNTVNTSHIESIYIHTPSFGSHLIKKNPKLQIGGIGGDKEDQQVGLYKAMMSGKIVKIVATPGQAVKKGAVLVIMESMKMETKVESQEDGIVDQVFTKEGVVVQEGDPLMFVKKPEQAAKK